MWQVCRDKPLETPTPHCIPRTCFSFFKSSHPVPTDTKNARLPPAEPAVRFNRSRPGNAAFLIPCFPPSSTRLVEPHEVPAARRGHTASLPSTNVTWAVWVVVSWRLNQSNPYRLETLFPRRLQRSHSRRRGCDCIQVLQDSWKTRGASSDACNTSADSSELRSEAARRKGHNTHLSDLCMGHLREPRRRRRPSGTKQVAGPN